MSANTAALKPQLTVLRWPRSVIARFVARRTVRSATFVALAVGAFTASKTIGYAEVYPTAHDRAAAAALLTGNVGFKALFGTPHQVDTVVGYASWYGLTMGVVLGGIWAYLIATRTFRGEEAAGRWEQLLAGLTTPARGAANALVGLSASLLLFFALTAVTLIAVGQAHGVGYTAGSGLYFALACATPAIMFMAVGAFTSQLMPTRARAAGLATAIFGVCYLVRAGGDITNAHWLINVSPLGWVEQLQPLVGAQPVWLVPIFGLTAVLAAATVWLAGRRDLGQALFADKDSSKAHLALLRGPFTSTIRFTRGATIAWLSAMALFLAFYGALTNTAAKLLSDSASAQHVITALAKTSSDTGARAFLGIAFFMFMLILMAYSASAVGAMRSDEAQGYLDNMLVRAVSRQRWLWSRIVLALVVIAVACCLAAFVVWASLGGEHHGLQFSDLFKAGLNALPAAVFTLGAGIFAFGVLPRFTTVIAYGVIAWSFIVELLSSGTKISHWVLDTSVFTHVAFAPAADPKWAQAWALLALGALLALVGAYAFNRRDLASE